MHVTINGSPSLSMKRYEIKINCTPKKVHIDYQIADSLNRGTFKSIKFGNNLSYRSAELIGKKNLSKMDSLLQDSVKIYYCKLDSAIKANTIYSRKKVTFNRTKNNYGQLLATIFNSDDIELNKNRDRGILDGTYFEFFLEKDNLIRRFQAHSPDEKSQPLFGRLIEQTLSFLPENERKKYWR